MELTKDEGALPLIKTRYVSPCLQPLGDIRQLTLGSSGCTIDSGGTSLQKPLPPQNCGP